MQLSYKDGYTLELVNLEEARLLLAIASADFNDDTKMTLYICKQQRLRYADEPYDEDALDVTAIRSRLATKLFQNKRIRMIQMKNK